MTMTLTQVTTGGVDENINIDSNTLKVDGTNNRVGIGTASPQQRLQVGGFSGSNGITVGAGSGSYSFIYLADGTGGTEAYRGYLQYNHATDNLELGCAGATAITIDTAGRVGINTTSPSSFFAGADQLVVSGGNGDGGITINSGTSSIGRFLFADGTTGADQYRGYLAYSHSDNNLTVGTNGSERLRIDEAGRILLGTTIKGDGNADDITIATSGHTGITIRSAVDYNGAIYFGDGLTGNDRYRGYILYDHSNNAFAIGTDATERLRIDGSGRLMLGSSTTRAGGLGIAKGFSSSGVPAAGTSTSSLLVGNDDGGMYGLAMGANGSGNGYIQAQRSDGNTTVYDLYLQPNGGKVSIGTTAANAQLNVYGGASATLYQNSNTGNGSGDGFFVGNWGGMSGSVWNYENDIINFGTNNAERVRIDNSGRLMVGRTTATHKLSLAGAANDKTAEIQLTASNVASGYIGPNSDGLNIGTDTAGIVFKTGVTGGGSVGATGTTRFSISSSGVITTNTVQQHFDRGSSTGQSSFTRDFTIGNTQSALVIAAFNHYGLFSYGCTKMSFAATGASFSTSDIHNQTSTPGGSWSISKPNNTTLRITKNAGNYNGSGHWFIHIIAS